MKRFIIGLAAGTMLLSFGSANAAPRVDDMVPVIQAKIVKIKKIKAHKTGRIAMSQPKTRKADQPRNRKVAVIIHGLMGAVLAPMTDVAAELRAKGYYVRFTSFTNPDLRGAAVIFGHSMGCFPAVRSRAPRIFLIDCPFWAVMPRAPHPQTANFYTAGHPRVHGAINVQIRATHLTAPTVALKQIRHLI